MFRRDKVRAPGYPYIYLYMQISSIRHRPWHARETHHISWTNFLTRNSKTISFSGWEREFHYTVKNVNSGTRIIKLDPPLKVQDKKQIKEQHPKKRFRTISTLMGRSHLIVTPSHLKSWISGISFFTGLCDFTFFAKKLGRSVPIGLCCRIDKPIEIWNIMRLWL